MTNSLPVNLRAGSISAVVRRMVFFILPPDEKVLFLVNHQPSRQDGRAPPERVLDG